MSIVGHSFDWISLKWGGAHFVLSVTCYWYPIYLLKLKSVDHGPFPLSQFAQGTLTEEISLKSGHRSKLKVVLCLYLFICLSIPEKFTDNGVKTNLPNMYRVTSCLFQYHKNAFDHTADDVSSS